MTKTKVAALLDGASVKTKTKVAALLDGTSVKSLNEF